VIAMLPWLLLGLFAGWCAATVALPVIVYLVARRWIRRRLASAIGAALKASLAGRARQA
jgi:hypothetical protein